MKNIVTILFIFLLIFGLVYFSQAQSTNSSDTTDEEIEVPNPLGTHNVSEVAARGIKYALGLIGVVALVMTIYGGLLWMTSGGKKEQIEKGKNTLVWAIFGLALVFFSYTIINFVLEVLLNK
ncbi:hypothetical protein J7K86_01775 [bacterium]|nr:hypothetical protein [bacterium]